MSMTVVVTRNVRNRIRGFLASTMLELSPGVYTAPRISPAVRERIWGVLNEWYGYETDASIVMLWADNSLAGGHAIQVLGSPPVELVEIDGLITARRPCSLKIE